MLLWFTSNSNMPTMSSCRDKKQRDDDDHNHLGSILIPLLLVVLGLQCSFSADAFSVHSSVTHRHRHWHSKQQTEARHDRYHQASSQYPTSPHHSHYHQPLHGGGSSKMEPIFTESSTTTTTSKPTTTTTKTATESALDSFKRRQLLFTMLVAACASATPSSANAAVSSVVDDATSTSTSPLLQETNVYTTEILKPPLDDRNYMTYTLGNNQLRVLLCSDPSSSQVAAAMDVHVGACSDPDYLPGLAHFTEHMLFLGTEPYPEVNSFETFLASNGGVSNAFTDSENTVYYFEMQASEKLQEGLLRFASFFSAPLFTKSATGRELNAIESEHAKNLQTDTFRIYQMEKARANPKHPYSKFFTGNKMTLLEQTQANGIDLREELKQFYLKYYSANQMTLAIVAPQPLEVMQQMVQRACANIPNHNNLKPELAWNSIPPFDPAHSIVPPFQQQVVEIVPVADLRQITIQWPMVYPSEQDRLESLLTKRHNYVAHLIGHEGPRSLLSYLKRQRWANSLSSSLDSDVSAFETFSVTVGLTTRGLTAVHQVMEAIFSYIDLMRNEPIPDYIFQEVLQLDELDWRFLTKSGTAGYVQSMATAMQKYPPPLYIAGPRRVSLTEPVGPLPTKSTSSSSSTTTAIPTNTKLVSSSAPRSKFSSPEQLEYTKSLAMDLISKLTLSNMMVTVLSRTFESTADRTEKWYGTKYRVRSIPQDTVENLLHPPRPQKLGLAYPKPNLFIPSEAGLQVRIPPVKTLLDKTSFEYRMQPIVPPQVIRDDDGDGRWTVYFKEDDRFGVPKAYIVFQLLTQQVFSSPLNAALAELYQTCVADRLDEYAYDAQLAGLSYDVKILPRGVRVTFGGYNDKLGRFATYITKKISKDVKAILPRDDAEFERYKDNLMRALSAFDVRQPFAHAAYYATLNLQPIRFQYNNSQLRDAARTTTLPDLVTYAKALWTSGRGQALVQGNFAKGEALDLVNAIDKSLGFQTIQDSEVPPQLDPLPIPSLPKTSPPPLLSIAEPNVANGNSACHVLLQRLEPGEKEHVLIELISAIVEEPFYGDLRTKQQLGYIVSSGLYALGKTRTISFIAQSSVATAEELRVAIIKFLDNVKSTLLDPLSKGDLAVYTKSLIERKTEPDKELSTEVTRNWLEISSGRLEFDRLQREAAALLEVDKNDVLMFWEKLWGDGRRALITEMIPLVGPAASPLPATTTGYTSREMVLENGIVLGIDDIEKFRRDREELSAKET